MNLGSNSVFSYEYYKNGLKKSFTNVDGVKYSYTYDEANRLAGIELPGTGTITYAEYLWAMPKKITLPGGTVKTVEYDPLMQVKGIKVKDPAENMIMDYTYTRDKEGNILTKNTQVGNYAYTYDKTYQLLKTVYPDGKSEEFVYDKAGNREEVKNVKLKMKNDGTTETEETVENYVHNDNNEIVSTSSILNSTSYISNYSFDLNGNMTKKTEGANVFEYLYNVENRLSAVKLNGHTLATYAYDPFGRRLWKQVEGVKTFFFYTDEGLSAEINNAGEVVKTYGYTPNSIWTTDPLWTREGGQYYYYQNDHLATPQIITSSNGSNAWSVNYESFGNATLKEGSSITNNLRFPGQYYDQESGGFHYNRYRTYLPEIGRYNQTDPMSFKGGDSNLYRYCKNKSINWVDPYGLYGEDIGIPRLDSDNSPQYNCMGHATGSCRWDQGGPRTPENPWPEESFLKNVKKCRRINKSQKCCNNENRVKLYEWINEDQFHIVKQEKDGRWSGKLGAGYIYDFDDPDKHTSAAYNVNKNEWRESYWCCPQ